MRFFCAPILALTSLLPQLSMAWTEHALGSYPALSPLLEQAESVQVESLAAFLENEKEGLALLLNEEEAYLTKNIANYPPLSDELKFNPAAKNLERSFLRAIRVNPEHFTTLYLHLRPGEKSAGHQRMPVDRISLLPDDPSPARYTFIELRPGEKVSALAVVATGSDEPDAGLDINIWEDSGTPFGTRYKFGKQSFGNPALSYSSQAPFHMGFYHESSILYALAGFIKRTYPDFRIRLFARLSSFAFARGHSYWGYRFAGWGLHYVQDLTQPYHATLAPGNSTMGLLWTNVLDIIGFSQRRKDTTQLLSNRHGVIENFQYRYLTEVFKNNQSTAGCFQALTNTAGDPAFDAFVPAYIYNVLTMRSNQAADDLDALIARAMPLNFVQDPTYNYDQNKPGSDVYDIVLKKNPEAGESLKKAVDARMQEFGSHSRNYMKAILENRL